MAPQWALGAAEDSAASAGEGADESAVVLSVFPAPGHTAPSFTTLPHMVLRDPQMPWVRRVSKSGPEPGKTAVPWFALLVFTPDELELQEEERQSFFAHVGAKLNDTLGWDTTASDVESIRDQAVGKNRLANFIPKPNLLDKNAKTKTSVIAIRSQLFKGLFVKKKDTKEEASFDVAPFRFMSHVRTVATDGTMSDSIAEEDVASGKAGTATFSIVVSHRLGPDNVDVPTPVLAHLVSLQGIDRQPVSLLDGKERVLMTSLYSWTYTALPPDSIDLRTALRHLGSRAGGLSVLRSDHVEDKTTSNGSDDDVAAIVTKRQQDGYTLVRHRTVTGEQTAAMYRGPLVPTRVPYPLNPKVSFQSNFGTDLQILDPDLGLMDISYSSAWQLGKTLAMGDRAFTAALSRLRTKIHGQAIEEARKDIHKRLRVAASSETQTSQTTYLPRDELVADLPNVIEALNSLNASVHATGSALSTNRWRRREPVEALDLFSLHSPHIFSQIHDRAVIIAGASAESTDGGPYNYHSVPKNTDYAVVQEWVLDRLHLGGVPAHYLLPDPSHMPPESLRFFHVDTNWTDALVDGALSLANHVADDPPEDFCRTAIKAALNRYFKTPLLGDYCQQMPSYDFFFRSQLLVQFPDLAVSAEFEEQFRTDEDWATVKPKAPILVQRKLATDIMLVLFDREPPGLVSLKFTLPAHQQTFIAAASFHPPDETRPAPMVEIVHKKIYALDPERDPARPDPRPGDDERTRALLTKEYLRDELFDWETRTLRIQDYAEKVHTTLQGLMPKTPDVSEGHYTEDVPTASVFALQLNEPIYTLVINARGPAKDSLSDWHVLSPPSTFAFHPPEFPTEKYTPKTPLPEPVSTPTFTPVKLLSLEQRPLATNTFTSSAAIRAKPPPHATDQPRFNFSIRPINRPPPDFVPTNRRVLSDLIFSITVPDDLSPWNYRLMQLDIYVQIGEVKDITDPDDVDTSRALISSEGEAGPPPTMLSNLRFNVLRTWDTEEGFLKLRVIPRTSLGVTMKTLREASFLLPMATVVPWDVPEGKLYPSKVRVRSLMYAPTTDTPFNYQHDTTVYLGRE